MLLVVLKRIAHVPRVLNYLPHARLVVNLAWISGALALCRNLLVGVPELFPAGEEIGSVVNTISLSYLGAFAFNILLVALPKQRDMKHSLEVASPHVGTIVSGFHNMLQDFYSQAGEELPNSPDSESLERVLGKLSPSAESSAITLEGYTFPPTLLSNLQLTKKVADVAERTVGQLTPMFANLDVELATLLFRLPNTTFSELAKYTRADIYRLDTLSGFAPSMYEHWVEIDRLATLHRSEQDKHK